MKFNDMIINDDSLILIKRKNECKQILFSDLQLIYISPLKLPKSVLLISVFFVLLFIGLMTFAVAIEFLIPIVLLATVPMFIKFSYYSGYELRIKLNNGSLCKMKFSIALKSNMIMTVNKIKKSIYQSKVSN
ncbi:hypothetical protein SAMN05444396_101285 [Flavobacterium segetis]|uniref:Uncharacterized protein n=1 Tax=Flavobacterium segetis TaxID=271157 RepID=A0A1M5EBZ2_9FLAO|nr:hypothetical protein [Flavobacterium segetis]SHF76654.1 hypothetical protein SAMN05444396_101285 [Flavobacterium segetis]